MITYDVFRVLDAMVRAVDGTADGLWHEVQHEREELISAGRGLIDEAVQLLSEKLEPELHPYVSDMDVADMAAALAFRELEGWDVAVEEALYRIEQEAGRRYDLALRRGTDWRNPYRGDA